MGITVIKNSGEREPFDREKILQLLRYMNEGSYAPEFLLNKLLERISDEVTTTEIHTTLINICLEQESYQWSRRAARLFHAITRKNMKRKLGVDDKASFREIAYALGNAGLWDIDTVACVTDEVELLYKELYVHRFQYWQLKQWADKYSLRIDGVPVETPHIGAIGIALAIHGCTKEAFDLARAIVYGKINLPTPVLNGCRNGDFDTISCCVISADDNVPSIGTGLTIAYRMTAKKAGIGIEFRTRSAGEPVRNGATKHLGKHSIYATLDKSVKMFTQVTRGGSATVTYKVIDPEILNLLYYKSQRVPENVRLDKMDYSMAYNDAFVNAVISDGYWYLFDYAKYKYIHDAFPFMTYGELKAQGEALGVTKVKARDILKAFLTVRVETGRLYCINLSRANIHTPFTDLIHLSNLCQEICLPTRPYMSDNIDESGETAFCTLAAINVSALGSLDEYKHLAPLIVLTLNRLIDYAPSLTDTMKEQLMERRSLGIGITGLAGYLYNKGLDYDGSNETTEAVAELAECHYYHLLKASQDLVEKGVYEPVMRIDTNWLPIDTAKLNGHTPKMDWEALRGRPRCNSVLVAHMPTESSAVFSDATNGLYPVRQRVVNKLSRNGNVQYIAPEGNYKLAWEVDNEDLVQVYSIIQDYTDQAISADYYLDLQRLGGKVRMSDLMKHWVSHSRAGVKTMYYLNTNDYTGELFDGTKEEACESCKL
jgi:ribonucleoside-diphosphate reductase alpha chain